MPTADPTREHDVLEMKLAAQMRENADLRRERDDARRALAKAVASARWRRDALLYLAGRDVAGWDAHLTPEEAIEVGLAGPSPPGDS